jgi:hypothetical protein
MQGKDKTHYFCYIARIGLIKKFNHTKKLSDENKIFLNK